MLIVFKDIFLKCSFSSCVFYIQGKVKKKVKNNSLVISGVSSAFFGFESKQKPLWRDIVLTLFLLPLLAKVMPNKKHKSWRTPFFFFHPTFLDINIP